MRSQRELTALITAFKKSRLSRPQQIHEQLAPENQEVFMGELMALCDRYEKRTSPRRSAPTRESTASNGWDTQAAKAIRAAQEPRMTDAKLTTEADLHIGMIGRLNRGQTPVNPKSPKHKGYIEWHAKHGYNPFSISV